MNEMKEQTVDSCPENIDETIERYLAGELPEAQMDEFEDHYFSCETCTARLAEQQAVMDKVAGFASELFPEDVQKTTPNLPEMTLTPPPSPAKEQSAYRWILNAVAAIILFGLTWYLYDPLGPRPNDFSANFVPNETLEQQIAMVSRTPGNLRVLAPMADAELSGSPVFDWESAADGSSLSLIVLDNKARKIFGEQNVKLPFQFPRDLAPGLYYWTLESTSETIYANRFYIRR